MRVRLWRGSGESFVPARDGNMLDVVLGYGDAEGYERVTQPLSCGGKERQPYRRSRF